MRSKKPISFSGDGSGAAAGGGSVTAAGGGGGGGAGFGGDTLDGWGARGCTAGAAKPGSAAGSKALLRAATESPQIPLRSTDDGHRNRMATAFWYMTDVEASTSGKESR